MMTTPHSHPKWRGMHSKGIKSQAHAEQDTMRHAFDLDLERKLEEAQEETANMADSSARLLMMSFSIADAMVNTL